MTEIIIKALEHLEYHNFRFRFRNLGSCGLCSVRKMPIETNLKILKKHRV